jgi:hypothetical protein
LAESAGNQPDEPASEQDDGNLQKELDRELKVVHDRRPNRAASGNIKTGENEKRGNSWRNRRFPNNQNTCSNNYCPDRHQGR